MEARQKSTGYSDKEDRNELIGRKIICIAELLLHSVDYLIGLRCIPYVPQLDEGIALYEHSDKNTYGGEQ